VVLCGFDNGKVVAVNASDGSLVWEATVAPSHGRTELEKLVDIDSAVVAEGANVYVVGFQGRVAMLALDSGQVWWSHEASSYRGLGMDEDTLYYSTAAGEVVALRKRSGAELWRQEVLKNRVLSAPTVHGGAVAVADFEGYVHWLDKATGALVARASSGSRRVSNPPVEAGGLLLIINDVGHITAFHEVQPKSAKAAPPAELPATPAETAPAKTAPSETPPAESAPAEPLPPEAPPQEPAAPTEPDTPPPPPQ
jgi:outer membrane protein assembly factor BamB